MVREERLAALLERWEESTDQGQPLSPEQLCREAPELLDDFRKLLARMGPVNALMQGNGLAPESPEDLVANVEAGRYRPVSFHAAGGLGMVFLAEDQELGRSVALKCMQSMAAVEEIARSRFMLEAEITGKLEHPAIVPVYGRGRDAKGRPYYAMRFVRGSDMAEAIATFHGPKGPSDPAERNVEFRRLLRCFTSVCDAAAYAHHRGIIHRDIKPGNIMLGKYGETLLVDWGLAKRVDVPDADGIEVSATGPVELNEAIRGQTIAGRHKGSPAYMSPEQARGDWEHVGPASDIYCLGTTLYAILTGKRPFEGKSVADVLAKVREGKFVPPRQQRPNVPAALAAICTKAMSFDPAQRYADARDLARDIERWLADEPVSAWREPFAVRARRWLRRHRTAGTAAIAALLVGTSILAVFTARLNEKNSALQKSIENEKTARADAERHLNRNLAHLEGLLRFSAFSKQLEAVRREPGFHLLIDEIANQFDQLSADAPGHSRARQVGALAHYLRAMADPSPGLPPKLDERLRKAEVAFSSDRDAQTEFGKWGTAAIRSERGRRLLAAGRYDEARIELLGAFDVLVANADGANPIPPPRALATAATALGLYRVWEQTKTPDAGETLLRVERALAVLGSSSKASAVEVLARISAGNIDPDAGDDSFFDPFAHALAEASLRNCQGVLLTKYLHRQKEGIAAFEAGLKSAAACPDSEAKDPILLETKANLNFNLALVRFQQKELASAWEHVAEAERTYIPVARAYPDRIDNKRLPELIELGLVETGLAYLKSLNRSSPEYVSIVQKVAEPALRALDRWQADQAARPASERNNRLMLAASIWRYQLTQLRDGAEGK